MLVIEGLGSYWYAWYDDEWTGCALGGNVSSGTVAYPASSYVRRHHGGQEVLTCTGAVQWCQVEDTAGPAFSQFFHANNLTWDSIDSWWNSYGSGLSATGIHGMWTTAAGD